MFDPEKAIAAWRARLAGTGSFFEGDLDELESHLRDHLESLEEVGLTGAGAFEIALERVGEPRALGDEFAKVNRALVWRAPLFWLTAGCFATLVALPLLHQLTFASYVSFPSVPLIYAIELGGPAALVAVLLAWAWARRGIGDPLRWAASPFGRVSLVAGGALLWLGAWFAGYPLSNVGSHGVSAQVARAANAAFNTSWQVGEVVRPLGAIVLVLALRAFALARAKRTASRPSHCPLFWAALGIAFAITAQELDLFAEIAASFASARSSLDIPRAELVVGLVTLVTPALVCGGVWAWSRRLAPSPDDFLRSRRVGWAFAAGSLAVLGAYLSRGWLVSQSPGFITDGSLVACLNIHSQGKLITAACTSVLLGALMLRARAGMLVAARTRI